MKGLCLQRQPEGRARLSHAGAKSHDTAINRLTLPSDGSAREQEVRPAAVGRTNIEWNTGKADRRRGIAALEPKRS
jgi:hypothetical protein